MYVKIGTTEYRSLRNLRFAPDADITCQEIPSNEFAVDIVTSDSISVGAKAELYDEDDNLWASYWIYDCYKIAKYINRVIARDAISLLDNRIMYQSMYFNEPVSTVIARIFKEITDTYGANVYFLDPAFANDTITGYLPQGKARDRFQDVCFAIGAYVKSSFNDRLQIMKLPDTETVLPSAEIPNSKIFRMPDVEYGSNISGLRIYWYDYSEIEKDDNVEWVEVNGKYYQKREYEIFVSNPFVSVLDGKKEISIRDIGVINKDNVSNVVKRLSKIYFDRISLNTDVLNEGEYLPADVRWAFSGITGLVVTGYITSANFSFGNKPRSTINLKKIYGQAQGENIYYAEFDLMYEDEAIDIITVHAPAYSVITIQLPYIEGKKSNILVPSTTYHYVLYPPSETCTAPRLDSSLVQEVEYETALVHTVAIAPPSGYSSILSIYQVDDVEFDTTEKILSIM